MEQAERPTTPEAEPAAASIPGLSGAIDQLLAHPELISMVASALGGGMPKSAPPAGEERAPAHNGESMPAPEPASAAPSSVGAEDARSPEALMTSLAPLLAGLNGKGGGGGDRGKDDERACLLRALKPYVSPGRREAIDTMIRLTRLTDLLKHMI